jgi:CheY-like chemotaxis protein
MELVIERPGVLEAENPLEKVLIVDDDEMAVEELSRLFSNNFPGTEILSVGDGISGLDLYSLEKPELVVLNDLMPKMSGFLVLENIRDGYSQINCLPYVIMISDNFGKRSLEWAESMGANQFFQKPVSDSVILKSVEYFVQNKDSFRWYS